MIDKASRYANARRYRPSAPDDEAFPGLRPRQPSLATPVLEHTVTAYERPDHLAHHYYGDVHRWWRLLDANPELLFAGDLLSPPGEDQAETLVGETILIPRREE